MARGRTGESRPCLRRAPAQRRLPRRPTSWPRRMGAPVQGPQVRAGRRRRGPARRAGTPGPRRRAGPPALLHERAGGPVKALATFYKVPPARIVAIHDELDIAVRHAARQARRRRQRPQRAALDARLARHRRLLPGARRHRPSAGPPGRRRLRAVELLHASSARSCRSRSTDAADAVETLITEGLETHPAALQLLKPRLARVSAVTFEPGTPPAEAATDDHVLATWLADRRREPPARGPRARASRARSSRTPATAPPTSC